MNIGDGLTFQSQTIGGKTTTGIFLTSSIPGKPQKPTSKFKNKNTKFSTVANPRDAARSKKSGKESEDKAISIKNNRRIANSQTNDTRRSGSKPSENEVVFINNNSKVDVEKQNKASTEHISADKAKPKADKGLNKDSSKTTSNQRNQNNSKIKPKVAAKHEKKEPKEIKVDTTFVTLTQDQLNTILSLVKTKQDIDVASALKKDTNEEKEPKVGEKVKKLNSSEGKRVEPTSVPGLDLIDTPNTNDESDKENGKSENVENLLERGTKDKRDPNRNDSKSRASSAQSKKDTAPAEKVSNNSKSQLGELSGTLGGFGSREKEKSRLEQRRKKWIEDLNEQVQRKKELEKQNKKENLKASSSIEGNPKNSQQRPDVTPQRKSAPSSATDKERKARESRSESNTIVQQIHEDLPTAIRSSFFLGEAVPRDHAFSAKKKQRQQAWKEELEKQIKEKEDKKTKQKSSSDSVDTNAWERHFETMNPPSKQSQHPPSSGDTTDFATPRYPNEPPNHSQQHNELTSSSIQSPLASSSNALENTSGIYSGDHTGPAPGGRVQGNYLRTMTALLDPSQLDALEVKRQKQLEHRRVIAEQVEERRRLKEEENRAKREEEEQEERRLEEERKKIKNQFEKEKNKQHAMEEKRDRQTQELYQQMKEAQATALKEKFERMQYNLKSHGHDTSRLERTHKTVLEKSLKPLHSPPTTSPVPSLNIKDLKSSSQPYLHHNQQQQPSPRMSVNYQQTDQSPVSVVANTGQGPIKLEISLNQKHSAGDLVATGVQTDEVTARRKKTGHLKDTLLDILSDSDVETEYMALPHTRSHRNVTDKTRKKYSSKKKMSRPADESADNQYNRYSRTNRKQAEYDETDRRTSNGPKPKWGAGQKKKKYVAASDRYVNSRRSKQDRDNRLKKREEELMTQQILNQPDRLLAGRKPKSDTDVPSSSNFETYQHYSHNRRDRSKSPVKIAEVTSRNPTKGGHPRSTSPPVPALMNHLRGERHYERVMSQKRPDTAMSVTTDQAKYKSFKHSPNSPVPDTDDYVEYIRSDVILDPNRPETRDGGKTEEVVYQTEKNAPDVATSSTQEQSKDPLLNSDIVRQKERQDKILKEISILRQGLLLKQREVASYPVAVATANIGKNLPERTNDNLT